jgi:ribonucleotide reductase alpha subunit
MAETMEVVKRDGRREPVAFEKVQARIVSHADGLTINPTYIAQQVLIRIVDGIKTSELDEITAKFAESLSTTHPDYGILAARIAISNHQKCTAPTFAGAMEQVAAIKDRRGGDANLLADDFLALVRAYADLIESKIDYSRDFLFDYFGFKTLEKAYLLQDKLARVVLERPQHLWMRVALGIWGANFPKVFETYELLSTKQYTHATPTLFNAGTKRPQLSSCFVEGTLIHTINGVKPIEIVSLGDEVVTHTGSIKKVLQLHKNLLNDRIIYDFKVAGSPTLSVTGNHRFMSISDEQEKWGQTPTWNSVEYLRVGDWIALPNKIGGVDYILDVKTILDKITGDGDNISYEYEYTSDNKVIPISKWKRPHYPTKRIIEFKKKGVSFNRYWKFDETMMELMGIWYGDGCVVHAHNSKSNSIPRSINIVAFHTNDILIKFVEKIFYEKLGISHVSVSKDKHNMVSISVNSQFIAHIFKEVFKCKFDGKRIPAFFHTLSKLHISAFLAGLVSSDGCVSSTGIITVQLTNPPLVTEIFHLARSVNIPITLSLMHKKDTKATGRMNIPAYIVANNIKKYYSDDRLSLCTTESDSWAQTKIINGAVFMRLNVKIPTDKKPEFVYTLGIEDDHSYSVGGIIAENCFLLSMKGDSIKSIYDTLADCALISQYGGGIGVHAHNIRAAGSLIRGTGGTSNGILPMLRVFNNTARYVDQCFDGSTWIHTSKGLKQIATIEAGDEVLTSGTEEITDVDGKHAVGSRKPRFCKVQRRVEHSYSGPILRVSVTHNGGILSITTVTPSHPVLAVKADSKSLLTNTTRVSTELASLDYYPIGELNVGDSIAMIGTKLELFEYLGTITGIVESTFTGTLYDLEVEEVHDYLVDGFGIAHNGGGKRNGSFAFYLEPWHADVEAFLDMKKNTGAEEERARDLFYALWIPDLFMERVDANAEWTLMCPDECPGLADAVGDAFTALYTRYEAEGRGRKTVSAQKLWFKILDSQIETGTPYLLYKDACNLKSNQQNLGTIKSSNLCVAPETRVLTRSGGEVPIKVLCGQTVDVWNGTEWSTTTVHKTNDDAELWTVVVDDTEVNNADSSSWRTVKSIDCTPYHKFILGDGTRVDARDLCVGDELLSWTDPGHIEHIVHVRSINKFGRHDVTYCFNEPLQHMGVFNGILTGNCSEIVEYSSPEETAVCNLASMNLPAYVKDGAFEFKRFRSVVRQVVESLNRVIDINYYPIPEARRSNMRHRPIGIGVQGLADVFAMLRIPWESEAAAVLNRKIFAHMYYAAVESSMDCALRDGVYETYAGSPASKGALQFTLWKQEPLADPELDWDYLLHMMSKIGLRNSLLIAPMPTASTAQLLGNTESIEPVQQNLFTRRTLAGEFFVVNRHLVRALVECGLWNADLKEKILIRNGSVQGLAEVPLEIQAVFKTVWEIKQKTLIDLAADRGPYVCQSQSLNLFISEPTYAKLTSMHFYAWRKGLKTGIYYLRTRAAVGAQQFTVAPTAGGAAAAAAPAAAVAEEKECLLCSS